MTYFKKLVYLGANRVVYILLLGNALLNAYTCGKCDQIVDLKVVQISPKVAIAVFT